MQKLIFVLFAMFSFSAVAEPHLDLLGGAEWKGTCRKVVNEAKQVVNKDQRIQSSYSFQDGALIWTVKSYHDSKCEKIREGDKYTFNCEFKPKDAFALCKQTKWESLKDGMPAEPKAIVDHADRPNLMEMKVKVASAPKGKVKITTIGESEDPETEVLSK